MPDFYFTCYFLLFHSFRLLCLEPLDVAQPNMRAPHPPGAQHSWLPTTRVRGVGAHSNLPGWCVSGPGNARQSPWSLASPWRWGPEVKSVSFECNFKLVKRLGMITHGLTQTQQCLSCSVSPSGINNSRYLRSPIHTSQPASLFKSLHTSSPNWVRTWLVFLVFNVWRAQIAVMCQRAALVQQ